MFALDSKMQFAFALCLVALFAHGSESKEQQDKMARIQIANIRNFPFVVQLRDENGKFFCGGSLISSNYVLTAAECFDNNDYTKTVVVAGASQLDEAGVHQSIEKVTKHPAYNSQTKFSNAAVLKLSTSIPLEAGKVAVIALMDEPITEDMTLAVMGWRHIAALASNPGKLTVTQLDVIGQEACNKEFNATPEKNIFCITAKFDEQFCVGDLGSPAVTTTKKVAGITTAAHNCDAAEHITSFTNVNNIRSFVEEAMK